MGKNAASDMELDNESKEGTATTNQYFATFEQISGCIQLIINISRSG